MRKNITFFTVSTVKRHFINIFPLRYISKSYRISNTQYPLNFNAKHQYSSLISKSPHDSSSKFPYFDMYQTDKIYRKLKPELLFESSEIHAFLEKYTDSVLMPRKYLYFLLLSRIQSAISVKEDQITTLMRGESSVTTGLIQEFLQDLFKSLSQHQIKLLHGLLTNSPSTSLNWPQTYIDELGLFLEASQDFKVLLKLRHSYCNPAIAVELLQSLSFQDPLLTCQAASLIIIDLIQARDLTQDKAKLKSLDSMISLVYSLSSSSSTLSPDAYINLVQWSSNNSKIEIKIIEQFGHILMNLPVETFDDFLHKLLVKPHVVQVLKVFNYMIKRRYYPVPRVLARLIDICSDYKFIANGLRLTNNLDEIHLMNAQVSTSVLRFFEELDASSWAQSQEFRMYLGSNYEDLTPFTAAILVRHFIRTKQIEKASNLVNRMQMQELNHLLLHVCYTEFYIEIKQFHSALDYFKRATRSGSPVNLNTLRSLIDLGFELCLPLDCLQLIELYEKSESLDHIRKVKFITLLVSRAKSTPEHVPIVAKYLRKLDLDAVVGMKLMDQILLFYSRHGQFTQVSHYINHYLKLPNINEFAQELRLGKPLTVHKPQPVDNLLVDDKSLPLDNPLNLDKPLPAHKQQTLEFILSELCKQSTLSTEESSLMLQLAIILADSLKNSKTVNASMLSDTQSSTQLSIESKGEEALELNTMKLVETSDKLAQFAILQTNIVCSLLLRSDLKVEAMLYLKSSLVNNKYLKSKNTLLAVFKSAVMVDRFEDALYCLDTCHLFKLMTGDEINKYGRWLKGIRNSENSFY